ncbi:MAG: DUF1801 domain-containing protein [Pseudonocardia sp.]|nr:DUF1801 domain-containing protein [Pseudonocardia sp.]
MTPDEYLAAVDEKRRADVVALDALIRETAPGLDRVMSPPGIGYGSFHYRYASGREGDAALLGLAANKRYLSLYVLCATENGYLAEAYRDRLPTASIGKSCVRFPRLAGVDVEALRELIAEAASRGPEAAAGVG